MSGPYVAYFDDSGSAAWPKGPPFGRQCFCAGVLIEEDRQQQLAEEHDDLLRRLSDATGASWRELHMSEYMHLTRGTPGLRAYCATVVLDSLLRLKPILIGRVVDLDALHARRKKTLAPFKYGLQSALYRANHLAQQAGTTFRAYVDGGDNRHERDLRRFVGSLKKPQQRLPGAGGSEARVLDRLVDNAAILDSETSPGAQYADATTWLLRQYVLNQAPWVRRLDRLWAGDPPRVVPGGGPLWLSDDHAAEKAAVDLLQQERSRLPKPPTPPGDARPYVAPEVPPPGARVKRSPFGWP